jgi:predicted nucleic acid-binding protein
VVSAGEATIERAAEALDDLLALPIQRHRHRPVLPRVWELRATLTAYDATYLALAEAVGDQPASLLTTDAAFARAIAAESVVEPLLVR